MNYQHHLSLIHDKLILLAIASGAVVLASGIIFIFTMKY